MLEEHDKAWLSAIVFILVILQNYTIAKRLPADKRIGPHNIDFLSIVYGSLLGDSHAERRINGNGTRICFYQEAKQKEYLLYLHSLVSQIGYTNESIPKIHTRLAKKGEIRQVIRFNTFTYQSLNSIHDVWYNNGIKRVPNNIIDYLSPLCLAIWVIDDGGRIGKAFKFATNSFTYGECHLLSSALLERYNIKSSVQSAGVENQYVVYVLKESIIELRKIVRPYMVNSILYKLG